MIFFKHAHNTMIIYLLAKLASFIHEDMIGRSSCVCALLSSYSGLRAYMP